MTNLNTVTTHWNEVAIDYDSLMNKDLSYIDQLDNVISQIDVSAKKILDIGCGTGALIEKIVDKFPSSNIVGLDPAEEMLSSVRKKFENNNNITYILGSGHKIDAEDGTFDCIVTNWALHHLKHEDKIQCAKEIYRVLKPGGKFILGDQFTEVMGEIKNKERAESILELLTNRAKYYLEQVSFERMLLQVKLMPKFLIEDGECLVTSDFWVNALKEAEFSDIEVLVSEPKFLMNKVIVGIKKDE
ncbi:MAG: class I SAM-dependent methyltransferase [Clostridiaceae bacterium]